MIEGDVREVRGLEVDVVTLSNETLTAVLTDLGARLLELHVPDREGRGADVVLQRPTLDDVAADDTYMGSTAGRYANRIRKGRFVLDDRPVQLSVNEGSNHLHGGIRGFDRRIWSTEIAPDGEGVTFWRVSPHGEEGYPGTLTTRVSYRLEGPVLAVDIQATTDATTVANLVHHSYFNLGGHDSGAVLDHVLQIRGGFYTPVDDDLLPTGEVLRVMGTPFDFTSPTPIGRNIRAVEHAGAGRASADGAGFDHNWVLDGTGLREVCTVADPASGRRLTLSTNQPGLQLYTGGYLDGVTSKGSGPAYSAFAGFTLETQTFPDAVNHGHFPPARLEPGETYHHVMRFAFSAQ